MESRRGGTDRLFYFHPGHEFPKKLFPEEIAKLPLSGIERAELMPRLRVTGLQFVDPGPFKKIIAFPENLTGMKRGIQ